MFHIILLKFYKKFPLANISDKLETFIGNYSVFNQVFIINPSKHLSETNKMLEQRYTRHTTISLTCLEEVLNISLTICEEK